MHESIWQATSPKENLSPLLHDAQCDVVIIGGGIAGLTAAFFLLRLGKKVIVVEKGAVASGESGLTTAHLTAAIDARYPTLRRDFGKEGAELAARASMEAIDTIEWIIGEAQIDCAFLRVPGFLYGERPDDLELLREEAAGARDAGLDATFVDAVSLPFATKGAVRYERQAQFHPRRYLLGVANLCRRLGGSIFTGTTVTEIHDGEPCRVVTEGGVITASDVIVAANVPINHRLLMFTKIAAYRSYAFASRVEASPIQDGLFWDTEDPYHYVRNQKIDGETYLIIGGNDHKTGAKVDTEESYASLLQYGRDRFGVGNADYRWSGQIIEPVDGLPFIGRAPMSEHIYIGTGFAGQGMTFGTIAGKLQSDLILGRESPYEHLLHADRVKPLAAAVDYVKENVDFPKYFMAQRLPHYDVERDDPSSLPAGSGAIVRLDGKKVAAFRDDEGELHLLDPVCPHLGCDVRFNQAEQSWDCPCHGSRFSGEGKVLNGPAKSDLKNVEAPAERG